MQIIGHRGALGYEAENTLRSVDLAIEMGVDGVEIDARMLQSGELAVIHDHKVDRTTNGTGYVAKYDLEQFTQLKASNGEHPSLLPDMVSHINSRCDTIIEIKSLGTAKYIADVLLKAIEQGQKKSSFTVQSFIHPELKDFKEYAPDINLAVLMGAVPLDYAKTAEDIGAVALTTHLPLVSAAYVNDAHDRGLEVMVWGVEDKDDLEMAADLGIDCVITDFPERIIHAQQTLGLIKPPLAFAMAS